MVPLPAGEALDQQFVLGGYDARFPLPLQDGLYGRHLHGTPGGGELRPQHLGHVAAQRHAASLPAGDLALLLAAATHEGGELLHPHELQRPPGEPEHIPRPQLVDEPFLHGADASAADVLHRETGVRDDGADAEAVAHGGAPVVHPDQAVLVLHGLLELFVGLQAPAPGGDEGEQPVPFLGSEVLVAVGASHFAVGGGGIEAVAYGQGHQVLGQHIEAAHQRLPGLDAALLGCLAQGGRLHQFQRMRGQEPDAADGVRPVTAAPGALHEARHALGAADLHDGLHRTEVHAQVQAAGADHGLQAAVVQGLFHPFAHVAVQRAVVQRDGAGQPGVQVQQFVVP